MVCAGAYKSGLDRLIETGSTVYERATLVLLNTSLGNVPPARACVGFPGEGCYFSDFGWAPRPPGGLTKNTVISVDAPHRDLSDAFVRFSLSLLLKAPYSGSEP